jgi:hypothetical protein
MNGFLISFICKICESTDVEIVHGNDEEAYAICHECNNTEQM